MTSNIKSQPQQADRIAAYRIKPKWVNQPTVAIRVPASFEANLLSIARLMDAEQYLSADKKQDLNVQNVASWLNTLDIADLTQLETALKLALVFAKERTCDRRLEQALIYLSDRCDHAFKEDGQGFNGGDAGFGNWLGNLAKTNQLIIKAHAKAGLAMIKKYAGQLSRGGLDLPTDWEQIAHQYPESLPVVLLATEEIPDRRIIVCGDKIAVYAPYDSTGKFQSTAKSIDGYRFNGEDKSWRFPVEKVQEITEKFVQTDYWYDPSIEGILLSVALIKAEELAKLENEALAKSNDIIDLLNQAQTTEPLANGWYLRNYQQQGVEWLLAHTKKGIYKGGILADQMGLGKTLTALMAAKTMHKKYNCAIWVVCPVSLKDNWIKEAAIAEIKIEVFSWSKFPKSTDKPYLLIADEAHYAQNIKSQRTQNLLELANNSSCLATWLLTGTPLKNGRPINLYPLLVAIGHPLAEDKKTYEKHYCNAGYRSIGKKSVWDSSGASHLDELSAKTEDAILRRTKSQCLKELPIKTRLMQAVELDSNQAKSYNSEIRDYISDYRDRVKLGLVDEGAEALVTLNVLRKTGSKYKVEKTVELANQLLEENQQVVIFTEFLDSAIALYKALGGELLTGESKPEDRQSMVDRFQSGESKVFIGTIKAGGVGITLTAASTVILVDRPWTPGDTEQAEDRCHRMGQPNAVFALWLQLGIIDEKIDILLQAKQENIEMVLKGKRKTMRGLDSPKELAKQLLEIL